MCEYLRSPKRNGNRREVSGEGGKRRGESGGTRGKGGNRGLQISFGDRNI